MGRCTKLVWYLNLLTSQAENMSQELSLLIWSRAPWILCGLGHMDSFFDPTISYLVRRVCFVLFGYFIVFIEKWLTIWLVANSTGKNNVWISIFWVVRYFLSLIWLFFLSLSLSLKRNLSLIRNYKKSIRIALGLFSLIFINYGKTSVFSGWSVSEKSSGIWGEWGSPFSFTPFLTHPHSLSRVRSRVTQQLVWNPQKSCQISLYFGLPSRLGRRNLTPVSNICEAALKSMHRDQKTQRITWSSFRISFQPKW